jgi:hypothetical protein
MVKLHELLRGAHLEDKRVSCFEMVCSLVFCQEHDQQVYVCKGHEAFLETAKLDEKGPCGDT